MQLSETELFYTALKPLAERYEDPHLERNVLKVEINRFGYAVTWKKANHPIGELPSHLGLRLISTGQLSSGFRDEDNLERILIYDPTRVSVKIDYVATTKQKMGIQLQREKEGAVVLEPHTLDRVVSIHLFQTPPPSER